MFNDIYIRRGRWELMLTSGLIVLTNIIEPDPEVKTYQFEAICNQQEHRDCEIKYIRVYLPEGDEK